MFTRVGFGAKISGGFGAVILILLALGVNSLVQSSEARDHLNAYSHWSELDMVMNEAVIANALRLQTHAHDYFAKPDKKSKQVYDDALNTCLEGLIEWRQELDGDRRLTAVADEVEAIFIQIRDNETSSSADHINQAIEKIETLLDTTMESVIDPAKASELVAAQQQQQTSRIINLTFTIIGTLLSALIAFLLIRATTVPINAAVTELQEGASVVTGASRQIAVSSDMLANAATEQAASLEESSAAIEQISSTTRLNAANSQQADLLMQTVRTEMTAAGQTMNELTSSMAAISKASEETSRIIKTIDEIAFQTNLLALNAAVEAARAGEAGAGFAVVAGEVRNLAQRAADAAKDTTARIDATVTRVRDGQDLVQKTGIAFAHVQGNTDKVASLIGEISRAAKEQDAGITEISSAITQMDSVVQQVAANAEESAGAAEELNSQIQQIATVTNALNTLVRGRSAAAHGSPAQSRSLQATAPESPCWQMKNCPSERKNACPAFPDFGDTCWKVTGTKCGGATQGAYQDKIANCRNCDVYHAYSYDGNHVAGLIPARAHS